jgi:hypothetical protein
MPRCITPTSRPSAARAATGGLIETCGRGICRRGIEGRSLRRADGCSGLLAPPGPARACGSYHGRQHHRSAPPANLSARSIQLGTAIAPCRSACRAERWHRGIIRPVAHIDRALVAAVLAHRSRTTHGPMPAHTAEPSVIGRTGSHPWPYRQIKNR